MASSKVATQIFDHVGHHQVHADRVSHVRHRLYYVSYTGGDRLCPLQLCIVVGVDVVVMRFGRGILLIHVRYDGG